MNVPSTYQANSVERRWYSYWMEHGYFHSEPDGRTPYTIVIPPPNVTGVLHMGHILNNTLQGQFLEKLLQAIETVCGVGVIRAKIRRVVSAIGYRPFISNFGDVIY